jgi:hypothetical protein
MLFNVPLGVYEALRTYFPRTPLAIRIVIPKIRYKNESFVFLNLIQHLKYEY